MTTTNLSQLPELLEEAGLDMPESMRIARVIDGSNWLLEHEFAVVRSFLTGALQGIPS